MIHIPGIGFDVFPADAGMNRWLVDPVNSGAGVPRRRGDEPLL